VGGGRPARVLIDDDLDLLRLQPGGSSQNQNSGQQDSEASWLHGAPLGVFGLALAGFAGRLHRLFQRPSREEQALYPASGSAVRAGSGAVRTGFSAHEALRGLQMTNPATRIIGARE